MLMQIITFIVGLAGALLLSWGSWQIYQPAGFIVGGLLCLVWSFMAARALAFSRFESARKQEGAD